MGSSAIISCDSDILGLWKGFLEREKISKSNFGAFVRRGLKDDFQDGEIYMRRIN